MRSLLTILILSLSIGLLFSCQSPQKELTREDLGWELGTQAYTFRKVTFFQAVDKTKELGLHYIEAYPGQKIGGGIDGVINYNIDSADRQKIKAHLKKQDVKLKGFGVIVPNTHAQWDSLFAFAKDMGIADIVSEPHPKDLPYVSELCDKYKINVAIHNHPKPSHYWSPDTLLASINGLSDRIGSCADIGHFVRSGLNALESVKKLNGHIFELHFKDVSNNSSEARDTVWGTGVCDLPAIIKELKQQNFKGYFFIEYETHPENNMTQIKQSISNFDKEIEILVKNQASNS